MVLALTVTSRASVDLALADGGSVLATPEPLSPGPPSTGLVADAVIVSDGTIGGGALDHLACTTSLPFTATDPGKTIMVVGAGPAGSPLCTTIATFVDAGHVTLTAAATAPVTNAKVAFGTDNGPPMQALLDASNGNPVVIPAGRYMLGVGLAMHTGYTLQGYGATLISALNGNGNIDVHNCTMLAIGTQGIGIALNADVAEGARTIQINGTLAVGDPFIIQDGAYGARYTVQAVAGAAPQTVTLDRATLFPYSAETCVVNKLEPAVDRVTIEGFTFTGYATGVMCEFWGGCSGATVRDLVFDGDLVTLPATLCLDFDLYSFNGLAENILITGAPGDGAGFDTCEACVVRSFTYTSNGTPASDTGGFESNNSAACTLEDVSIGVGFYGVEVYQQAPPTTVGNSGIVIRNGSVTGCTSLGVLCALSQNTLVDGLTVEGCANGGISVGASSVNVRIANCNVRDNRDTGIVVNHGAVGTFIQNCELAGNTPDGTTHAAELFLGASTIVRDCTVTSPAANNTGSAFVDDTGGVDCLFDGVTFNRGNDNGECIATSGTAPRVRVTNCTLALNAAGAAAGISHAAGVLIVDNTVITGGGGNTGIVTGGGTTFRQGSNIDAHTCGTPLNVTGHGSRGTVLANGAAAVAVTWPDLKSDDVVVLTLVTKGGAPSAMPLLTYTPGTGFSVTSYAGDTSTYGYQVQ